MNVEEIKNFAELLSDEGRVVYGRQLRELEGIRFIAKEAPLNAEGELDPKYLEALARVFDRLVKSGKAQRGVLAPALRWDLVPLTGRPRAMLVLYPAVEGDDTDSALNEFLGGEFFVPEGGIAPITGWFPQ